MRKIINPTHIFFIDELGAGGISTNIIALVQYLDTIMISSIIVSIKNNKNKNWDLIQKSTDILSPKKLFIKISKNKETDYIFFTNSARTIILSYLIFLLLKIKTEIKIKIIYCVYNPLEFSKIGFWQKCYRYFINLIGKDNIYFMNGTCLYHHQSISKNFTYKKNFLPLVKPYANQLKIESVIRADNTILTVGRFVGFKMHYIRNLIYYAMKRPLITINIVGYGSGEDELKKIINDNKVANVNLLGKVDYASLSMLYSGTSCYVGMGTTLIEASSLSTPAFVAITGVPGDVCYGYFIDQDNFDMGEFHPHKPFIPMTDALDSFFCLSKDERNKLGASHFDFAKKFSLEETGSRYIALSNSSKFIPPSFIGLFYFLLFMTISIVLYVYGRFIPQVSRYDRPYL